MTFSEMARRLGKARWADHQEWLEAWDAFGRLDPHDQQTIIDLVRKRYPKKEDVSPYCILRSGV